MSVLVMVDDVYIRYGKPELASLRQGQAELILQLVTWHH